MKTPILVVLMAMMGAGVAGTGAPASPTPAPPVPARWTNGPPESPDYFPIAVWLQSPKHAIRFKEAGINLHVHLYRLTQKK